MIQIYSPLLGHKQESLSVESSRKGSCGHGNPSACFETLRQTSNIIWVYVVSTGMFILQFVTGRSGLEIILGICLDNGTNCTSIK
jgi:hypothetical protein